jgi:ATP-binding cassette subfamily B protein
MKNNTIEPELKKIKITDLMLLKSLWVYIKPYFLYLFLSVVLIFLITGFDLLLPYLTKKALDGFILAEDIKGKVSFLGFEITSFLNLGFIFISAVFLIFIIDFFQSLLMEYTGQKIILDLRLGLFSHMADLPVSFYDKNSTGRLVSRVTSDIENMNEMFSSILIFIFKDFVLMAAIVVIMFFYDVKFAAFVISVVPLVIITVLFFSRISRKAFRTMRQKIAGINNSFSENISGIKIIHTTSSFKYFFSKFNKLNYENFKAGMTQIKIFGIFMPLIEFFNLISLAIIIVYGGWRVTETELTTGVLVAFISYMKMFFRPVRDLSEKFNLLQNAFASAERIVNILNEKKDENNQASSEFNEEVREVEFKNVWFSYTKNEPVLKNISFKLKKGESLGIAGHTGAGKSSIINLISGFYSPDSGSILINGKDINKLRLQDLRRKAALVMQDPVIFSGSVRSNLISEKEDKTDNFLKKSLIEANCGFLFENNNGLDFEIAEGGRPLSSGEKQLLSIARAFACDPEIIIFDEATSYIDSHSEQKIHEAMNKLMQNRTSILIAHRLSTLKKCDNIIVLKNGEIIEKGTHEYLMELEKEYYSLVINEKSGE